MNTQSTEHPATAAQKHPNPRDDGELTVLVFTPRVAKPKHFTWPETLLVGTAADEAAAKFEYEAGTPTFQDKDKAVLDRSKTLQAEGVKDHDRLELVDTGGGV